jgi:hypothetical protein
MKGFQTDHVVSIGERRKCRNANGLGILEFDEKRYELKIERRKELSQLKI